MNIDKMSNIIYSARAYLDSHRPRQAEELLEKVLETDPGNFEAKLLLGYACKNMGNVSQAILLGREVLAEGSVEDGSRLLAECFYTRNQVPEAIKYHEKVIELNPGGTDSLAQLVMLYYENKEDEKARDVMDRALRLDPLHSMLWWNIFLFFHNTEDNTVMENQALEKLAQMEMPLNEYTCLQAKTAAKEGRYSDAYDLYKKAFVIDPRNQQVKYQLEEYESFYKSKIEI